MNKILRAAVTGAGIGAALFFVPFLFRFLLFVLLAGFIIRAFGRRRRRYYAAGWHRFHRYHTGHYQGFYDQEVLPIDGRWYAADINRKGPANDIPIS